METTQRLLGGCLAFVLLATGCAQVPAARNEPLASLKSPEGIAVTLEKVIVPNPASSMKRGRWDEYVVSLRNAGCEPIEVTAIELESVLVPKGVHSRGRKLLEDATNENIRILNTAHSALRTDLGDPQVCAPLPPAAVAAALVGIVVRAIVFRGVVPIGNVDECKDESELRSRGFDFPLPLEAGSSATRSLFFPMTPAPVSLRVRYKVQGVQGEIRLRLEPLARLHLVG
jgi:hypothetical protein